MTDKNETTHSAPLPPYISFRTFSSFIQKLKETTVPPRVDGSMLTNYAGSVARQLVLALKYLELIQPNGATNASLREIVAAYGTDTWKDEFGQVIAGAYSDLIGGLDLDSATYLQLQEAFRKAGTNGVVLDRAIGFYLAANRDIGWALSPHFNKPRRPAGAKPRGRTSAGRSAASRTNGSDRNEDFPPPSAGTERFTFPIPGKIAANIVLPRDLAADDWEMIDSMIRTYIGRKEKATKVK